MARNEQTSAEIASIAGRILDKLSDCGPECDGTSVKHLRSEICTVGELKALAASALTQASDKPKRKRIKKVVK